MVLSPLRGTHSAQQKTPSAGQGLGVFYCLRCPQNETFARLHLGGAVRRLPPIATGDMRGLRAADGRASGDELDHQSRETELS